MRRRDRGNSKRYELLTPGGTLGIESKGWILLDAGELLVKQRKAERIHDTKTGTLLGYQLTSAGSAATRFDPQPEMDVSDTVLTRAQVDAVVGEHCKGGKNIHGIDGGRPGRSATAGLGAAQRKLREALGLEAIDFVEASRFKLNAFDPRNGRRVVSRCLSEVA
jgi:hypothetical protein